MRPPGLHLTLTEAPGTVFEFNAGSLNKLWLRNAPKGDGIVNWRTAIQQQGHDKTQNIRVLGSHCGLTHNAAAWHLIGDRLQYKKSNWVPFESRLFQHD